jgi:predicted transcriptional regulator
MEDCWEMDGATKSDNDQWCYDSVDLDKDKWIRYCHKILTNYNNDPLDEESKTILFEVLSRCANTDISLKTSSEVHRHTHKHYQLSYKRHDQSTLSEYLECKNRSSAG